MVRCMGIGGPALAVWWLRIADLLSYQLNLFTHTNSKQLNKTRAPLLWDPQSTSRDLVFVYLSTAHPSHNNRMSVSTAALQSDCQVGIFCSCYNYLHQRSLFTLKCRKTRLQYDLSTYGKLQYNSCPRVMSIQNIRHILRRRYIDSI